MISFERNYIQSIVNIEELLLLLEARSIGDLLSAFLAFTSASFFMSSSAIAYCLLTSFILLDSTTLCNGVFRELSTALTFALCSIKYVTTSSSPKCWEKKKNYEKSSFNHMLWNWESPNLAATDNKGSPLEISLTFAPFSINSFACLNGNRNQSKPMWNQNFVNQFDNFTIEELPLLWAEMDVRISFNAHVHQNV